MKNTIKIAFFLIASFWSSFVFADKNADAWNGNDKVDSKIVSPWVHNDTTNDAWNDYIVDKTEQQKVIKNINNIIIESYKAKFSKILQNLYTNVKWKTKEEKLSIYSSVLLSVKVRLDQIESWKVKLSENKKEVLLWILKYIKQKIENDMQYIVKETN